MAGKQLKFLTTVFFMAEKMKNFQRWPWWEKEARDWGDPLWRENDGFDGRKLFWREKWWLWRTQVFLAGKWLLWRAQVVLAGKMMALTDASRFGGDWRMPHASPWDWSEYTSTLRLIWCAMRFHVQTKICFISFWLCLVVVKFSVTFFFNSSWLQEGLIVISRVFIPTA